MIIKILPGEYIWSSDGFHILNEKGCAQIAEQEMEVDVTNVDQIPIIESYHQFVRGQ